MTRVEATGIPIPPGPTEPMIPPSEQEPLPDRDRERGPERPPWEQPDEERRKINLPPDRPTEVPVS
jgi:hypothetical protein